MTDWLPPDLRSAPLPESPGDEPERSPKSRQAGSGSAGKVADPTGQVARTVFSLRNTRPTGQGELTGPSRTMPEDQEEAGDTNTVIYPLTLNLIKEVLTPFEMEYASSSSDTLVATYHVKQPPDATLAGARLTFMFCVRDKKRLYISWSSGERIPQSEWIRALVQCNSYNKDYQNGRAWLGVPEGDDRGLLIFEHFISLEEGTTKNFLTKFIMNAMVGAQKLYVMIRRNEGLDMPLANVIRSAPSHTADTTFESATAEKRPEPLSTELLERALDRLEIKHMRNPDDTSDQKVFMFLRAWEKLVGADLVFTLLADIQDAWGMVSIRCTVEAFISQTNWERALHVCNEYNKEYLYGRAFLVTDEKGGKSMLVLDMILPVGKMVTEDFIINLIRAAIGCAKEFFEKAHSKEHLY